jgi:hypothetical protein
MDLAGRDLQDSGSTGFRYSRRTVLKTGGALGLGTATAGCSFLSDDSDSDDGDPTPAGVSVDIEDFIADGLHILDSNLVDSDVGAGTYLRIVLESTLDEPIEYIGITAQFFEEVDGTVEFSTIHQATIDSLAPSKVFEGYIRCFTEDPAAYVIQADRTRRTVDSPAIDAIDVDHCLGHKRVTGTISNTGSAMIPRFRIRSTFYSENGDVVGSGTDTVTRLTPNTEVPFEVGLDRVVDSAVEIEDYSLSVADYSDAFLAVR